MTKPLQAAVFFLFAVAAFTGCRKKVWDEYYGRPENLEPPIYQTLEAKGNFKNLLAAIDKSGYKKTLAAAGYWTLFAPHDSAFQAYFAEKGITSIEQLDSIACEKIVTYCLVYNAFNKERIDDYQSTSTIGWVPNSAFRRRTASYTGVYDAVDTSGKSIKAISSNRNGLISYVEADNNNKYITYFVDNFMNGRNLTATDYNYFYPNSTYTGFNVLDAKVTERDIPAENGIIHVVNKVITSLPSIDEYLSSNQNYSLFKSLFDRFLVYYAMNQAVSKRYQNTTGNMREVYVKGFNPALAYALNNENFLKTQDNDGQNNCYSVFVPTNDVLQNYIDTLLLKHFNSLEEMPVSIIYDFVNAHLWQNAVWPSKFNTTLNFVNEEARFNANTDIVDKKILSNGMFYGTKKVQDANIFSSVYGKAYLNPEYSMMTTLLNIELRPQVSNIYRNYTIFMMSNTALNAAGYTVDPSVSNDVNLQWRFTPPPGSTIAASTGSSTLVRLQRLLNMHVIPNIVLNNLAAQGVAMSYSGEYIAYKNGTILGSGNVHKDNSVAITSFEDAKNGRVYYTDKIIEFADVNLGTTLEKIGTPVSSDFNFFFQYLKGSTLWNNSTKEIIGVPGGSFYTLFVPNNAAIQKAVNEGKLPGTGAGPIKTPTFNPTNPADQLKVTTFIYYHFLNKRTIASDGVESGSFETIVKKSNGDPTTIFVNNSTVNDLKLKDMSDRDANFILLKSNYLSDRTVIHLIDNYLTFSE